LRERRIRSQYKVKVVGACDKIDVGDKITLLFSKEICERGVACADADELIKTEVKDINGEFYVTGLQKDFGEGGGEVTTMDLSTEPFVHRNHRDIIKVHNEYIYEHEYRNEKEDKQRKTTQHDIDAMELDILASTDRPGTVFRSISNDKIYLQEWRMKFVITDPSLDEDFFVNGGFELFIDGINVTVPLQLQYPGVWPPATPNIDNLYPNYGVNLKYDIVEAALSLGVQNQLLTAGEHSIQIQLDGRARIKIYEDIQYSEISR